MNPEAQEELTRILSQNPESLTFGDIQFLNARRDYLNREQRRIFASVLIDEDADPSILGNESADDTPKAKVEVKKEVKKEETNEPTTKELVNQARELGIDEDAIMATKTNEELVALIEAGPTKVEANPFNKGNADPDAK